MEAGQVDTLTKLADAFKSSGPFFFAVLLALGWLWTMTKAIEVYRDKERAQRGGLRIMLLAMAPVFLVGTLVVGWRAIDYWLEAQDAPFGRYATIVGVPNDINVWADAAQLYQQKLEAQRTPTHSLRVAFLFKSQCAEKEVLIVQMNRDGMAKPDTFRLNCSALDANWQTRKAFDLGVDDKGTFVLKEISVPDGAATKAHAAPGARFALITDAVAGGMPAYASLTQRTYEPLVKPEELKAAAATLQSPTALPGAKLQALGRLEVSVDLLKANMTSDALTGGLDEPLYATLLDLQRHSDRQLAKKAELLVAKLPLGDDLARLSASAAGRSHAARILDSMADQEVAQALQAAKAAGQPALVAMLSDRARKKTVPPVPTYTRDGDRFFVKASWNNTDDLTVQCVGKAYYEHWGGASLKQQTDLARSRATRTVYYTKDWSREMVRMLQACGAQASYVQGSVETPEAPTKVAR